MRRQIDTRYPPDCHMEKWEFEALCEAADMSPLGPMSSGSVLKNRYWLEIAESLIDIQNRPGETS